MQHLSRATDTIELASATFALHCDEGVQAEFNALLHAEVHVFRSTQALQKAKLERRGWLMKLLDGLERALVPALAREGF